MGTKKRRVVVVVCIALLFARVLCVLHLDFPRKCSKINSATRYNAVLMTEPVKVLPRKGLVACVKACIQSVSFDCTAVNYFTFYPFMSPRCELLNSSHYREQALMSNAAGGYYWVNDEKACQQSGIQRTNTTCS